jgi:hypothetical protein
MRSTIKYGIITGIIVGGFAILFFTIVNSLNTAYSWGMQPENIRGLGGLLTIPILATGIFLTMSTVKKEQDYKLTYLQALKTGVLVAVITAIIVALFSYIYCIINPGFAQYMLAEAQKVMQAKHESQQQIAADSINVLKEYAPGTQVFQALVGQTVIGTVMSLIIGLFVRSRKSN